MAKKILILSGLVIVIIICSAGWSFVSPSLYLWAPMTEGYLRHKASDFYYKDMQHEGCVTNSFKNFDSMEDCQKGVRCISDKLSSVIPSDDLRTLVHAMKGGENADSAMIEYFQDNPGIAKQYETAAVLCLSWAKQDQGAFQVVTPNGGESWTKGKTVRILWNGNKNIKSVNIRLEITGNSDAQNFNAKLASNVPNSGSYDWTVQELYSEVWGVKALPASDKYILTIEDSQHSQVYDKSNATFTIK